MTDVSGGLEKIEGCPFCGGQSRWRNSRTKPTFYVSCWSLACGAIGPEKPTLAEAITAWNTRPALLRDAGDGDSARLDWLESGGRVSHDKVLGMFVAAHGGGTPYWNATYRGAIDDAISGYKDTAMHAPGGAG